MKHQGLSASILSAENQQKSPHKLSSSSLRMLLSKLPPGYMLMVCLRSSTPRKLGLLMPQGVGIVDNDYCGEEDELKIQVYNFTDEVVKVERGSRIAQGIFVRVGTAEWNEVEQMSAASRGGFGSTDPSPL